MTDIRKAVMDAIGDHVVLAESDPDVIADAAIAKVLDWLIAEAEGQARKPYVLGRTHVPKGSFYDVLDSWYPEGGPETSTNPIADWLRAHLEANP